MMGEPRGPIPGNPGHYYHNCPCEPQIAGGSMDARVESSATLEATGRKEAAGAVELIAHDDV